MQQQMREQMEAEMARLKAEVEAKHNDEQA